MTGASWNHAQVIVPPAASLDVQAGAAPMPVRIAGRSHLAYELHITNFRNVEVTLAAIDVCRGAPAAASLASYRDVPLRSALARIGIPRSDTSDTRVIAAGGRVVFYVWLGFDAGRAVPAALHHRLAFSVSGPAGSEEGSVESGLVTIRHEQPIVLDAPLRGERWVAVYDPAIAGGHRRAIYAIDGKARIPARFAIDWIKLDDDERVPQGNAAARASAPGYGAEVFAVADGVVADVAEGLPEPTVPITLDNARGNAVTLDLGGGPVRVLRAPAPRQHQGEDR